MSRRNLIISKDDTRRMDEEAKKMECKMEALRRVLDAGDSKAGTSGEGRWRSGAANKPLTKGYVQEVLEAPGRTRKNGSINSERRKADSTPLPAKGSRGASGTAATIQVSAQGSGTELAPAGGATSKPCLAASTLQAAMQQQCQDVSEVEKFLAGLKLDRYVRLFYEHGIDCMKDVENMDENHMREIGMAPGHIIKLKKHLAEIRCVSAAPLAPNGLESGVAHASYATNVAACGESGDHFDGIRTITDMQAQSTSKAGDSFWSKVGGDEVDLVRASTPLGSVLGELRLTGVAPGIACQAGEKQHRPPTSDGEDRLCCYHCYRLFCAKDLVERISPLPGNETRRLCSEACANAFMAAAEVQAEAMQKRRQQIEKMKEVQLALETEKITVNEDVVTAGVDAALPTTVVA